MSTGDALITRGPCETTELLQTEEVGYKLDGLILAEPHRVLGEAGWDQLFAALTPGGVFVDVKSVLVRNEIPPHAHYWSL